MRKAEIKFQRKDTQGFFVLKDIKIMMHQVGPSGGAKFSLWRIYQCEWVFLKELSKVHHLLFPLTCGILIWYTLHNNEKDFNFTLKGLSGNKSISSSYSISNNFSKPWMSLFCWILSLYYHFVELTPRIWTLFKKNIFQS